MSTIEILLALLNLNRLDSVEDARKSIADKLPHTVKLNTDDSTTGETRFILSLINKTNHSLSQLHSEANGIIIAFSVDAETQWRLLVSPPRILVNIYNRNYLTKNMLNYTITAANDGTILSLYYYGEKWCISTARLLEANNVNWISNKSYSVILDEVLSAYELSLDSLDTSTTYTFGFHHPEFHPFTNHITAWYVANTKLPNIPKQESVVFPANFSREKILNELLANNARAMSRYIESGVIHYGYILRYENSNIILESDLFTNIKKIYYSQPRPNHDSKFTLMNEIIQRQIYEPKYRNMFVVLRAYMNYELKYVALSLFPRFKEMYDEFDKFFNELSAIILLHIHDSSIPLACKKEGMIPTVHERSLDNLLAKLVNHIKKIGGLCPTDKDSKSIIIDFLLDENYTFTYINYLIN
jgi:hypothetical protein